eukprot:355099-Chlamydomonas_euryale.AAC.3
MCSCARAHICACLRCGQIKKDLKMEMEVRGADAALMLDEAGDFMDEDLRQVLDRAERREHSSSRFKRRIVR